MAINTVKTRIQLKNDTEANWALATNFVPLKGELIIYSIDAAHPFCRLKVGDGVTTVGNLPFLNSTNFTIYVDTTANYRANPTFIPHKGDIVIFLDKEVITEHGVAVNVPGIKIGDGLAYNLDLPFVGDEILDKLNKHINDEVRHITAAERQFWNNKLNLSEAVEEETLILNRK